AVRAQENRLGPAAAEAPEFRDGREACRRVEVVQVDLADLVVIELGEPNGVVRSRGDSLQTVTGEAVLVPELRDDTRLEVEDADLVARALGKPDVAVRTRRNRNSSTVSR